MNKRNFSNCENFNKIHFKTFTMSSEKIEKKKKKLLTIDTCNMYLSICQKNQYDMLR